MSAGSRIAERVQSDAVRVVRSPARAYRGVLFAIDDVREGRTTPKELLAYLLATVAATCVVFLYLFPVYWVLTASLSGDAALLSTDGIGVDPNEFSLDAYSWVLFESRFVGYLGNSVRVVIPTMLIAFSVIVPASYALSRRAFLGRTKILYMYVLFTQVGAGLGIAGLIAIYAMFAHAGLTNNHLVLAFLYAAMAVPFNTWLLKTYMDSIPVSYEEAALIDGAPRWRIIWEIIIPLSKPGLAVILIFTFLAGWNEFIIAQTVLRPENYTLPVGLYMLVGEFSTPWARFSAFALLFASPVVILYFLAQRYVESGLSFGGMEG